MSKLRIIRDVDFKYSDILKESLTDFNKEQSGIKEKDVRYFYVFDDHKLVGACYTKQNSDWCHIKGIYYNNIDVLKSMMNAIKQYYKNKTVGIKFNSIIETRVSDFETIGFIEQGSLKDMPEGNENVFLLDKSFVKLSVDEDYDSKSSKTPIEVYNDILNKKIKKLRENLEFSSQTNNVQFAVLDGHKFVGGILGNFQYEYLFINRLYVSKLYRGKRLASRLIKTIEKEAIKRQVRNVYLTTFEFQALGLYKKKGYSVVMEINDYPKGFKEYTVYKEL